MFSTLSNEAGKKKKIKEKKMIFEIGGRIINRKIDGNFFFLFLLTNNNIQKMRRFRRTPKAHTIFFIGTVVEAVKDQKFNRRELAVHAQVF